MSASRSKNLSKPLFQSHRGALGVKLLDPGAGRGGKPIRLLIVCRQGILRLPVKKSWEAARLVSVFTSIFNRGVGNEIHYHFGAKPGFLSEDIKGIAAFLAYARVA